MLIRMRKLAHRFKIASTPNLGVECGGHPPGTRGFVREEGVPDGPYDPTLQPRCHFCASVCKLRLCGVWKCRAFFCNLTLAEVNVLPNTQGNLSYLRNPEPGDEGLGPSGCEGQAVSWVRAAFFSRTPGFPGWEQRRSLEFPPS